MKKNSKEFVALCHSVEHQAHLDDIVKAVESGFSGEKLLYGMWLEIKAKYFNLCN